MRTLYLLGLPFISSALLTLGVNLIVVVTLHFVRHFILLLPYSELDAVNFLTGITAASMFLILGLWGMSKSPRAFLIRSFAKERRQSTLDVLDFITGNTLEKTSFSFNRTILGLLASKFRVVRLLNKDAVEQIPKFDPGYICGVVFAIIAGLRYLTGLQNLSIGEAMLSTLPSVAFVHFFLVLRSRVRINRKSIIGVSLDHYFLSGRPMDSMLFHQDLHRISSDLRRFGKEMAAPAPMFGASYIRSAPTTFSQVYCSEAHWPQVVEVGLLTAAFCLIDVTEVFHGSATHRELVLLRKIENEGRRSRLQTTFVCSSYDYERAAQYCADNFDIGRDEIISIDLTGSTGQTELEHRMQIALMVFLKR